MRCLLFGAEDGASIRGSDCFPSISDPSVVIGGGISVEMSSFRRRGRRLDQEGLIASINAPSAVLGGGIS